MQCNMQLKSLITIYKYLHHKLLKNFSHLRHINYYKSFVVCLSALSLSVSRNESFLSSQITPSNIIYLFHSACCVNLIVVYDTTCTYVLCKQHIIITLQCNNGQL